MAKKPQAVRAFSAFAYNEGGRMIGEWKLAE
jgi:hypothetical protein